MTQPPRSRNLSWLLVGIWSVFVAVFGYVFWRIFGYGQRLMQQPRLAPRVSPAEAINHQSLQTKALRIASSNVFAGIEKRRLPDGQEKFVLCAGVRNFREPWARDFGFASFGLIELNEYQATRECLEVFYINQQLSKLSNLNVYSCPERKASSCLMCQQGKTIQKSDSLILRFSLPKIDFAAIINIHQNFTVSDIKLINKCRQVR